MNNELRNENLSWRNATYLRIFQNQKLYRDNSKFASEIKPKLLYTILYQNIPKQLYSKSKQYLEYLITKN